MTELMKRYEAERGGIMPCGMEIPGGFIYSKEYVTWLEAQLTWRPVDYPPKVDIAIGQKVKFQGKHAVCAKYREGDCSNCILQATPLCATVIVPCEAEYRADETSVYFPEVKQQQPPWNYIGEEAIPCPEQMGDNEWCSKEGGHR